MPVTMNGQNMNESNTTQDPNQVPLSVTEYIDQRDYYASRCAMLRAQIEIREKMLRERDERIKELEKQVGSTT